MIDAVGIEAIEAHGGCVLHACDTPTCVRLAHLRIGTRAQNMRDAALKGRVRSKLSPSGVREIRRRATLGESQRAIGLDYGICQPNVSMIVNRETWAHVV